jgi:hypothetical protein
LTSDPATDPLVDTTINGELPLRALRSVIEDDRARGFPASITEERLSPNRNPPHIVAKAQRWLEAAARDRAWRQKLARAQGDIF